MIKYHFNIEQGSPEWHKLRKGIITASEVKNILTPAKLEMAKGEAIEKYVCKLVYEKLYGFDDNSFVSWDMERGNIEESLARDAYSANYAPVKECGFVTREFAFENGKATLGYSPDGLVGDDGLIECKSRAGHLQVLTFIDGEMPKEYNLQIQTGLLVTDRKWCDFVSYSNGLPVFRKRILPDPEVQHKIALAAASVNEQMQEYLVKFESATQDAIKTQWVNHILNDYNEITA